jgi:DNA-binding CsgD family transcriptional regulator
MVYAKQMPEAVAKDWLQRADLPLFLMTDDLRLVWSNASANALMTQYGLRVDPFGQIRSSSKDVTRKIESVQRQFQAAIARRQSWPCRTTTLVLTDFAGGVVRLYELMIDGMVLFGCAVMSEDEGAKDMAARLAQYGLTNTERKIVAMLAGGATAIEIAQASGSSLLTVRTHIKRAYEKMEVNSREKMFARLTSRSYPATGAGLLAARHNF